MTNKMSPPLHSHRDVIRLLGGPTAIARCLRLEAVNTTVHWGARGVPTKYRQRLSEIAAAKGVEIRSHDWDALTVQRQGADAA